MTARHKHEYPLLGWHLGPYGRQDVHIHSCFTDGCNHVLVGDGQTCAEDQPHARKVLTISVKSWQTRSSQGQPLTASP